MRTLTILESYREQWSRGIGFFRGPYQPHVVVLIEA